MEKTDELCAQIASLSHTLEIVMALQLCQLPAEFSESLRHDLVRIIQNSPPHHSGDKEQDLRSAAISRRAFEITKVFAQKVEAREQEIRSQMASSNQNPHVVT